jgi:hypothetical protein
MTDSEAKAPGATEEPTPSAGQGTYVPPPQEPMPRASLRQDEPPDGPGKSISLKKLEANRANAQHSTGPRTEQGKEASKINATKHGFTARHFLGLLEKGSADWQEFIDLGIRLHDHFQPVGPIEELLVEKIVVESLRYGRLRMREQTRMS